jgi:hypothetical protein
MSIVEQVSDVGLIELAELAPVVHLRLVPTLPREAMPFEATNFTPYPDSPDRKCILALCGVTYMPYNSFKLGHARDQAMLRAARIAHVNRFNGTKSEFQLHLFI